MAEPTPWKEDLLRLLRDRWASHEVFSLAEAYGLSETLAALHPDNLHVEEKIRQVLQILRDEGEITFEDDDGHYSLRNPTPIPGDPVLKEQDSELRKTLLTIRDLDDHTLTSERLLELVKGFGGQKGIYKPSGSSRALWVRQTSRGVYPDKEIDYGSDGSWTFRYAPEGRAGKVDLSLDTNRGLLKCKDDGVPVGVFRQVESEGGKTRYEVLGLAYVEGMEGDHFVLRGESNDLTQPPIDYIQVDFSPFERNPQRLGHVVRVLRERKFGISVRRLYHNRCSLCNLGYRLMGRSVGLEAAHIVPVEEGGVIGDSRNGLLLCRNHHALFDQYAWTLNRDFEVVVAPDGELRASAVDNHVLKAEGSVLPNLPSHRERYPASSAIDWRLDQFSKAWK